jgi:hypothetical protein
MSTRRRTRSSIKKGKKNLGRYKSSLEKYCADCLADAGIKFDYEPESFVLQDSFVYDAAYYKMTSRRKDLMNASNKKVLPITYTPDFIGVEHDFVIETKGYTPSQHTFPIRWKLFLNYLYKNGRKPALFMPKNKDQVDEVVTIIKTMINDGKI